MNIGHIVCPSCRSGIVIPPGKVPPVSIQCATCGLDINLSARSDQAQPTMSQPTSQAIERPTRWGMVLVFSLGGGILVLVMAVGLALWLAASSNSSDVAGTSQPDEQPPRKQDATAHSNTAPAVPQPSSNDQEDSDTNATAQGESKKIHEESKNRLEPQRSDREIARARREAAVKKGNAIPLVQSMDKLDLDPSD